MVLPRLFMSKMALNARRGAVTNKGELWTRIKTDWPELAKFVLSLYNKFGRLGGVEVRSWPKEEIREEGKTPN